MQHSIPLSDTTVNSIRSIYAPLKKQYINFSFMSLESDWVQAYNVIKDESWPECVGYKDFNFLPDHIKSECIGLHQFSPEIYKKRITDDADALFQIDNSGLQLDQNLLEFLNQNIGVIQNKKVIDIGCGFGYWSAFAHYNHCSDVIGVDVRKENVDIALAMQQEIPHNRMKFELCDVHDHDRVSQLCADRDTVLLLGLMYHVHDHYDILKSICQPNVKNIVMCNVESSEIVDSDIPLIHWKYETTFELIAGFHDNQFSIPVGRANPAWFDLTMEKLGFGRQAYKRNHSFVSQQKLEKFKQFKSIYLYQRV